MNQSEHIERPMRYFAYLSSNSDTGELNTNRLLSHYIWLMCMLHVVIELQCLADAHTSLNELSGKNHCFTHTNKEQDGIMCFIVVTNFSSLKPSIRNIVKKKLNVQQTLLQSNTSIIPSQ